MYCFTCSSVKPENHGFNVKGRTENAELFRMRSIHFTRPDGKLRVLPNEMNREIRLGARVTHNKSIKSRSVKCTLFRAIYIFAVLLFSCSGPPDCFCASTVLHRAARVCFSHVPRQTINLFCIQTLECITPYKKLKTRKPVTCKR